MDGSSAENRCTVRAEIQLFQKHSTDRVFSLRSTSIHPQHSNDLQVFHFLYLHVCGLRYIPVSYDQPHSKVLCTKNCRKIEEKLIKISKLSTGSKQGPEFDFIQIFILNTLKIEKEVNFLNLPSQYRTNFQLETGSGDQSI